MHISPSPPRRCWRAAARAQRLLAVTSLLLLTGLAAGCVPTDDPDGSDQGFVPFDPNPGDMAVGQDSALPDEGADEDQAPGADDGMMPDPDADMAPDAPDADMGVDADMGDMPRVCRPNDDGVITREEVPLRSGLSATYAVTRSAMFNTAGAMQADGSRVWDMEGALMGDERVIVEAQVPTGRWFSNDFPQASYVTRLSQSQDLLGIFQITDDALLLLGVSSPDSGTFATKISYEPPVEVLSFPISQGESWGTASSVSGMVSGSLFPLTYEEEYSSQVDAYGELRTPYGTLQVQRVRTELTRTANFVTTKVRTYAFVSECFGTVATIVSRDNEASVEFSSPAELRRLSR